MNGEMNVQLLIRWNIR